MLLVVMMIMVVKSEDQDCGVVASVDEDCNDLL